MLTDFTFPPQLRSIASHQAYRRKLFYERPEAVLPGIRYACPIRILLLADGFLNFGMHDFGLSAFVNALAQDGRTYVRFIITLAHRGGSVGDPGIKVERSIPNFRFNKTNHFKIDAYDQVWLFGAVSSGSLPEVEKHALSEFMNAGGGVFATGDHGALGRNLCGDIIRVRKMRRWDNSSGEVGMNDPNRNDTNRIGHDAGSQFDDQSDDVPQIIEPKLYSSYVGAFYEETYPHPLLCGREGVIRILPDHPHEGECVVPPDLRGEYSDGSPEFPGGVGPEIIAFSTVPAGNTAGVKQATNAQTFGAICAYDGHKAGVGRVVTDATWHHFVNVNLIGEIDDIENNRGTTEHWTKRNGFLSTPAGQAALAQIKYYYVNTAVWLSPAAKSKCLNTIILWLALHQHRLLEATMDHPFLARKRVSDVLLYEIGTHARDVLGKMATRCRVKQLVIDLILPTLPEFVLVIDPWRELEETLSGRLPPWINTSVLEGIALGSALLAVRDAFMDEAGGSRMTQRRFEAIMPLMQDAAAEGLRRGLAALRRDVKRFTALRIAKREPRSLKEILKEQKEQTPKKPKPPK